MKWIPIISKGRYTLLQSESDTQYVVAANYNPNEPENQQWSAGTYFCYWDMESKAECLADAIDYFRSMTEPDYIPRQRLEEMCTKFKDKFIEICNECSMSDADVEYELEELDLQPNEREWLGLPVDTDLQIGE